MVQKILIADNDGFLRNTLKNVLELNKYRVVVAENGQQARDILTLEQVDLVISDIEMPFLTGVELLEWCKGNRRVPIVLMTGFSHLIDVKRAYELGAAGFLAKPFDVQSLLEELGKIFLPNKKAEPQKQIEKAPEQQYCKILIDDFISGSKVPFSIYVKVSESKYIKVAHSGEDVSIGQIKSYKDKGVSHLYITKTDYHKLVGFNLKLAKAISQKNVDPSFKRKFLKYTGEVIAQSIFLSEIDRNAFNDCKEFTEVSLDLIADDREAFQILEMLNSHADFLYAHSLGVSLYGVMVARQLGWLSPQTAFKVSLSGLYHDIGKKEIPRSILEKQRIHMTLEERKLFETHPTRGKEIMESVKSFPSDVAEVAFQHHEHWCGTGYPRAIKKLQIHPIAGLIGFVNLFCELAIRSPSSPGMGARDALDEIRQRHLAEFDPAHANALQKLVK